ncbi:hypothetical protein WJX74_004761 [Apatococcus lobatus]|uniref:Uncharacterized protein n=1 Tax=Apatococcus lobatus TaxID=904363 RepID=A0AAW1Q520_9CHLO
MALKTYAGAAIDDILVTTGIKRLLAAPCAEALQATDDSDPSALAGHSGAGVVKKRLLGLIEKGKPARHTRKGQRILCYSSSCTWS